MWQIQFLLPEQYINCKKHRACNVKIQDTFKYQIRYIRFLCFKNLWQILKYDCNHKRYAISDQPFLFVFLCFFCCFLPQTLNQKIPGKPDRTHSHDRFYVKPFFLICYDTHNRYDKHTENTRNITYVYLLEFRHILVDIIWNLSQVHISFLSGTHDSRL